MGPSRQDPQTPLFTPHESSGRCPCSLPPTQWGLKPPCGAGPQPCQVPSPPRNDSVWDPDSHCRNGVWSPSGGFLDVVFAADAQAPFLQAQAQCKQAWCVPIEQGKWRFLGAHGVSQGRTTLKAEPWAIPHSARGYGAPPQVQLPRKTAQERLSLSVGPKFRAHLDNTCAAPGPWSPSPSPVWGLSPR